MKLKSKRVLAAVVIAAILIFGIPILINECYKHGGYTTMWEAADVLSYYGTILGSFIAVATLAITILFTRKQIQRETYLQNANEHWSKIDEIFVTILNNVNPMKPVKATIEKGQENAAEAIAVFQNYQMFCQTATDELILYLNSSDYLKVKKLLKNITTASNQYFQIAEEEVAMYCKLRSFTQTSNAQQAIDLEAQHPGSFPVEQLEFCQKLLDDTRGLNCEVITQNIKQLNHKMVDTYENSYRPLLALKRTTFEEIDNEVQKEADSILHLWRK